MVAVLLMLKPLLVEKLGHCYFVHDVFFDALYNNYYLLIILENFFFLINRKWGKHI